MCTHRWRRAAIMLQKIVKVLFAITNQIRTVPLGQFQHFCVDIIEVWKPDCTKWHFYFMRNCKTDWFQGFKVPKELERTELKLSFLFGCLSTYSSKLGLACFIFCLLVPEIASNVGSLKLRHRLLLNLHCNISYNSTYLQQRRYYGPPSCAN